MVRKNTTVLKLTEWLKSSEKGRVRPGSSIDDLSVHKWFLCPVGICRREKVITFIIPTPYKII